MTDYFAVYNKLIKVEIIVFSFSKKIRCIKRYIIRQYRFITNIKLIAYICL